MLLFVSDDVRVDVWRISLIVGWHMETVGCHKYAFKSTLCNFSTWKQQLDEVSLMCECEQEKVSSFSPWASVLCDSAEWVPSPERTTDWESQTQPAAAEEWSWTEISYKHSEVINNQSLSPIFSRKLLKREEFRSEFCGFVTSALQVQEAEDHG